jgi:hypothetical protein
MEKEDAREFLVTPDRLMVAIDRDLGIADAGAGKFRLSCVKKIPV